MTTEFSTTAGTTDNPKETLTHELKGMLGKAEHLLKDAGHTVAEDLSARRHAIAENACGAATATDAYVRANPWKIIGIAATVGAFIGALISRR